MGSNDEARLQLRAIRTELSKLMQREMEEWEAAEVVRISSDAHAREKSIEGVRDFDGTVWADVVEQPTEQAWAQFVVDRKRKSQELADKANTCIGFWKDIFKKWGAPALRR